MTLRLSVVLSLVALLALAGLQYHWIGEIAVAERQRLERGVAEAAGDLAEELSGELRNLAAVLDPGFFAAPADPASIAMRYRDWSARAMFPGLVKSLYIARADSEVLRLDPDSESFEPATWPAELAPLADYVSTREALALEPDTDVMLLSLGRRFPPPSGGRGPAESGLAVASGQQDRGPGDNGWIVVELDHHVIVRQMLPRLVAQRFAGYERREYRVAVVSSPRGSEPRTIFTSGKEWTEDELKTPDYEIDVFGPPLPQRRGAVAASIQGTPRGGRGGERGSRGPDRGPMVRLAGQNWRVLVKHRAGSVATAVMEFRRRNLAISFGVLIVLGISAVVIVVSGSRARRLGRLQMEFAAGVSHELRTPLAVIQSAAHNLGSGIVQDREGIQEYAAIVKGEARRLTDMVEQVMAYTATQSGRTHYELGPVHVGDVVEAAVRNVSDTLAAGGATLGKEIDPDLPPVMADAPALTRCLQNLLSNAVKYGSNGQAPHIDIEARHIPDTHSAGKVQLSVIDHGCGVPDGDVPHLFEAFYRGSNASTNTPGNGLGLHLVDRIMQAQNGSVAYERSATGGAKFTLTLQAAANNS